jgi:hypothetical protein
LYLWYTDTIKKEYFNVTLPVYTRWLAQQTNGEFPSGGNRSEIIEALRVKVAAAHGSFCTAAWTLLTSSWTVPVPDYAAHCCTRCTLWQARTKLPRSGPKTR